MCVHVCIYGEAQLRTPLRLAFELRGAQEQESAMLALSVGKMGRLHGSSQYRLLLGATGHIQSQAPCTALTERS